MYNYGLLFAIKMYYYYILHYLFFSGDPPLTKHCQRALVLILTFPHMHVDFLCTFIYIHTSRMI